MGEGVTVTSWALIKVQYDWGSIIVFSLNNTKKLARSKPLRFPFGTSEAWGRLL